MWASLPQPPPTKWIRESPLGVLQTNAKEGLSHLCDEHHHHRQRRRRRPPLGAMENNDVCQLAGKKRRVRVTNLQIEFWGG
jgi:hypothetical protein